MKKISALILCILICLFTCSCSNATPLTSTQVMMDTVITITLYDGTNEHLKNAIKMCRDYEQLLSRTIDTSDIGRINSADGNAVAVSDDTLSVLKKALDICENSEGKFDVTVCPITDLWNVSSAVTVPDATAIEQALSLVDYSKIMLGDTTVTLPKDMKIDLGGIAKGYIADKVAEYLKSCGVKNAVINLGGNILIIGNKQQQPYSVGIQKPFSAKGDISAKLLLENKSAVTSGIYERYFESDGKIYHHITDTATGYPVDNGILSVTVIADSSALADGLSTACLALGTDKGLLLAKSYGAEAIFIDENGKFHYTDGLTPDHSSEIPTFTLKD